MAEPVHIHVPHELTESRERLVRRGDASTRARRDAAARGSRTVGIAWSGYQAARWSGLQTELYTTATHTRTVANREATRAGQQRLQDLLNFNRWLEVSTEGNTTLTDLYLRRFRPQFRPAFDAWLAQDPLNNPECRSRAPSTCPSTGCPGSCGRIASTASPTASSTRAKAATENTDDYILNTVFLAVVLFFAGISLRFTWSAMRITVLVLGAVFLVFGLVRMLSLPIH